ncbi:hypothetical protein D5086_003900 [Populus alba]|uniref:Uncharacterized protein n=1 Tax=Populus alba TaxID=43335 RepID=A0ACC4D6X9_POPAL
MAKPTLLAFLLILIFNITSSSFSATAAGDDSVYESFLQCLESNTNPQEEISKLVYSQSSTSYTSVLRAYIRNARYNTSYPLYLSRLKSDKDLDAKYVEHDSGVTAGGSTSSDNDLISDGLVVLSLGSEDMAKTGCELGASPKATNIYGALLL